MIAKVDMQDQADDDDTDEAHVDASRGCSIATPSDATLHKLMDHLHIQQRGINHLVEVRLPPIFPRFFFHLTASRRIVDLCEFGWHVWFSC